MKQRINNSISIVMPVFNEEKIISKVVGDFFAVVNQFERTEFIIVNDSSTDSTLEILIGLQKKYPSLKVINNDKNRGHGASLMNAYLHATGDYIFQCDSDNQFVADDFWLLWEDMNMNNRDLVIGYRKQRNDPFVRLIVTRLLRLFILLFFRKNLIDSNNPFRLYRKGALLKLLPHIPRYPMIPSILATIGAASMKMKIGWVPVRHQPRLSDKSFLKNWKILRLCAPALKEVLAFRKTL